MALIPRVLGGNYGDGTFGIKTSLPGYDVSVLADDNDVTKRSFNSQWTNLAKIRVIGIAAGEWVDQQYQSYNQYTIGSTIYGERWSVSGWSIINPVIIPTGLTYIPIWEERLYDVDTGYFYDDNVNVVTNTPNQTQNSQSGGRSYHSGPSTTPANSIFVSPHQSNQNYAPVENINKSAPYPAFGGSPPPYPAYPSSPPKPTKIISSAYVIYSNKMGDVT